MKTIKQKRRGGYLYFDMSLQHLQLVIEGQPNLKPVDVNKLSGKWYVVQSTLSLWRNNVNPSITYKVLESGAPARLDDLVTYGPTNSSSVHGIDTQSPANQNIFTWRGSGCLCCTTSNWCILGIIIIYKSFNNIT